MNDRSFISRRACLQQMSCGFGSLAFAAMAGQAGAASSPLAARVPHVAPRAKRVIFLFMQGGVSQVDSFDYKPRLQQEDGKSMYFADARSLAKSGTSGDQRVMKPLWDFRQHGDSGLWVSDLFPKIAQHSDKLCVIRSMHTEGVAHGPATLFLHTGSTAFVRPSMGAWVTYGLGSENENLPGFVTLSPSLGNGGPRNYGQAFLPAMYQGTALGRSGLPASKTAFQNLAGPDQGFSGKQQALLRDIHTAQQKRRPVDTELEAVINSYELAWRMQSHAPQITRLDDESDATKSLYGIGEKPTDNYGRLCLMARRLCESGVRFIQVNYGDNSNNPAWDQHSNLPKHGDHARAVDQPVAGLLADLEARGLLEDTLVWWGGEFGRTPYAEKNGTGRDHNPGGFSVFLAGGGVKPGFAYGETDEFGHLAVHNKVHMHDLHATILHQLGLDHERLTFRHLGRDYRLTDVHGTVVHDILA